MSDRTQKVTRTFVAHDEEGTPYTIHQITEFLSYHGSGGPRTVEGVKELQTDDGEEVNYEGKGRYRLVDGIALTSDDPDAP